MKTIRTKCESDEMISLRKKIDTWIILMDIVKKRILAAHPELNELKKKPVDKNH